MKIAIDCCPLAKTITGIGTYTRHLVRSLAEIDSTNQYFLLAHKKFKPEFELPSNFEIQSPPIDHPKSTPFLLFESAFLLRPQKIDIFHGTNFLLPFGLKCPAIATVHDLSSVTMPQRHSVFHRISHNLFLKGSLHRAKGLIAVSHFTENEIARIFPQFSHKTVVIHEAASEIFGAPLESAELDKLRYSYGLPERFILFVGTLEPRKNLARLLRAFTSVESQIPHKLVIIGGKGWKFSEIFSLVSELKIADRTIFTDYVPFETLPVFYQLAEFTCYPSLYEGFGLPVLEAMACGCPVLTSTESSMAEIVGSNALLVDPYDINAIAEGILRLSCDDNLRKRLSENSLKRAGEFSWQTCARKTLAMYENIV